MALLPAAALEPKEARIGLPPSGITLLWWDMHRASGVTLARLLLCASVLLFLVRPATVWAFRPGDLDVLIAGKAIFITCVSRSVKRHPEFLTNPNRRELEVPLEEGHPLFVFAYAIFRARRCRVDWCTQLRREAGAQKHGAARMSAWLRAACPPERLPLPAGRRLSAYSLRIAGVSALRVALHVEPDFVMG